MNKSRSSGPGSSDHKFVTVETYERIDQPGVISLGVNIDTFTRQINQLEPVVLGIADAIREYVGREKAAEIYATIQPLIIGEVEKAVKEHVQKKCFEVIGKMDIETIAKLAAIGAAKELGAKVTA